MADPIPTRICHYCARPIAFEDGQWIDPDARGDDAMWRETCDGVESWPAEHYPRPDTPASLEVSVVEAWLDA